MAGMVNIKSMLHFREVLWKEGGRRRGGGVCGRDEEGEGKRRVEGKRGVKEAMKKRGGEEERLSIGKRIGERERAKKRE